MANPESEPPDVRVVKHCAKNVSYFRGYGAMDHQCPHFMDEKAGKAAEAAETEKGRKAWKHPTERKQLPSTSNVLALMTIMHEDNIEAGDILIEAMALGMSYISELIENLNDMNIRGAQIPIAAAYVDNVIGDLCDLAKTRDALLVDYVNDNYVDANIEEAVTHGAHRYGHAERNKKPGIA
jgi:hypothetical protein